MLIKRIFDLFCKSSGQKASEAKSRIYFSKNVDGAVRNHLCHVSGFSVTEDIGKYLGVPILHERVTNQSFKFILDEVDQRLSNWKAKSLSFAGRLTLTKSVIQVLPSYIMQSAYIPRHLCDDIDKRCKSFLWGDAEGVRHLHTVSWENVCRPKKWGGLGLRTARSINQASLIKAGWDLTSRREDLWVQVVRAKYKCGKDIIPTIMPKRPGSNLWRGLRNA